jgi:hypothetical protein
MIVCICHIGILYLAIITNLTRERLEMEYERGKTFRLTETPAVAIVELKEKKL